MYVVTFVDSTTTATYEAIETGAEAVQRAQSELETYSYVCMTAYFAAL